MGDNNRIRNFFHLGDDLTRIVALSDGLFATVLTILVLDLRPDVTSTGSSQDIPTYLLALWPKFFNYLLTFIVAGLFWIRHHWIFEHVRVYNRRLLWLNLMFLLCVVLLPFTTSLLGTYNIGLNVRWDIYAGVIILISLTIIALWEYAYAYKLVDPNLDPNVLLYARVREAATPLVFLLSILLEPVLGSFVYYIPILIVPIHLIATRVLMGHGFSDSSPAETGVEPVGKRIFWWLVSFLPLVVFLVLSLWILSLVRN
jgi:uncharacterized membrane protein